MAWRWSLSFLFSAEMLFSASCLLLFSSYLYRSRKNQLPVDWPVVGMLPGFLSRIHDVHEYGVEILTASNWTFMFKGPWFLGMDMLVTCDPANVNHAFVTKCSNYPKGKEFTEIFDMFGNSLINTDGEEWKMQRRMTHSLMSNQNFRYYELKTVRDKVVGALLPLLRGVAETGNAVDLQDVFLRLTFDVACSLILGVDPGCLAEGFPVVPFAKALDDALEVIFFRHTVPMSVWKAMRWLGVGKERKMAVAQKDGGHEEGEAAGDMLTDRLEFDKFIEDNAIDLLLAGRDTTAAGLTWYFWLLALHPEAEQKILEELKTNWPRTDLHTNAPFDRDGLGKLVYLHAAVCESLRLYPPGAIQHKGVAEPDTLPSGEKVRPGTKLLFHLYSMARMEGIWGKDCAEFKPERWITETGELRHEPAHKFFAFNCGPRICLGKDMAFTIMKTVAVALLRSFRFEVVKGHVAEPRLSIVLHMKNGLLMKVRKRERSW
ncbi:Cytochrome P450 [Musa troglodytarum]|uniref:Cytochrome P450 n=1 Tax=Musa troglodytarum TaxID=320322 RepID=A0A9E7FQR3_9LILI|nr:Cytochrome P450 [Musa troglodytarum]